MNRPLLRKMRGFTARTLLIATTLLALGWAEENWRGARAWQHCRTELAACGESLDPGGFPSLPPVADVENFITSPAWGLPVFPLGATAPHLPEFLKVDTSAPQKYKLQDWAGAEPVIRALGKAARSLPHSLLPPGVHGHTCYPRFKQVVESLVVRGRAAQAEGQPDAAADSIDIVFRIQEAFAKERTVNGKLEAAALSGIIVFAWSPRAGWSVEQCERFERNLRAIDCLAGGADAIRLHRAQTLAAFDSLPGDSPTNTPPRAWWPQGWKDLTRKTYTEEMQRMIEHADGWPGRHTTVFLPRPITSRAPWEACGLRLAGFSDWQPDCLGIQERIDLARLALAVEHFRALHHTEPPSPQALLPMLGGTFPLSRTTGQPRPIEISPDGKWTFRADLSGDSLRFYPTDWAG